MIFSVPNESQDGKEAQKKVNMGLMRGVSDLIMLLPGSRALFLECKTEIGYQSPYQKVFEESVVALGFSYHIYRSLEQFQAIVTAAIREGVKGNG